MKTKNIFGAILALLISGCEFSTQDGKIPNKYLENAKEYTGIYRGQFEGRQMDLKLDILPDSTAQLTVVDLTGNNQLITGCQSQIGRLVSANVDKKTKSLEAVHFSLKAASCKIAGTTVDIQFNSKNDISVSVVNETRFVHLPGDLDCSDRPNGGTVCHHTPGETIQEPMSYLTGSFSK